MSKNVFTISFAVRVLIVKHSFSSFRSWLSGLENTKWLHNIASLLKAATLVVNVNEKEGRPVLVHCSDGWDRTPQIVSLAELMLDPYYRTARVSYMFPCTPEILFIFQNVGLVVKF